MAVAGSNKRYSVNVRWPGPGVRGCAVLDAAGVPRRRGGRARQPERAVPGTEAGVRRRGRGPTNAGGSLAPAARRRLLRREARLAGRSQARPPAASSPIRPAASVAASWEAMP